ncbi:MAG: hypothetical protein SGILL_000598 [Bacillariaceae sp.]
MSSAKSKASKMINSTVDPATASLQETLQKIQGSLLPSVEELVISNRSNTTPPSKKGLDFLHAKNTLLLSYIIDWMVELRENANVAGARAGGEEEKEESDSISQDEEESKSRRQRLLEMRTVLEKTRGLDKKLRYQIDKLLASAAGSDSFVTVTRADADTEDQDTSARTAFNNPSVSVPEDPLQFRPDPKSLLRDDDENSEEEDGESDDSDDDDDLKAARQALAASSQTKKSKFKKQHQQRNDDEDNGNDNGTGGVYRAPRLTAVPYTLDTEHKQKETEKRRLKKLRASELALTLKDQFGDAPEQEGVHGNATDLYGEQRTLQRKLKKQQREKEEYEMDNMMRLQTSRQEKKDRKRLERMMQGGGDLAQMANLGNLVRETQAFGKSGGRDNDEMDEYVAQQQALEEFHRTGGQRPSSSKDSGGGRHANGKRRRDRDDFGSSSSGKTSRMPAAKNSLQAELYGESGGSSRKKSKKSRRS